MNMDLPPNHVANMDTSFNDKIIALGEEDRPTMTEDMFVSKWVLPFHQYYSGLPVPITLWLQDDHWKERAGITAYNEVDIVDNKGEVIYVVPPLLMPTDKLLPKSVAGGVVDVMYRAENLDKVFPGSGARLVRNEITEFVKPAEEKIEEFGRRWDSIFVRYNLEPIFYPEQTTSNLGNSSSELDFEDYDSFED